VVAAGVLTNVGAFPLVARARAPSVKFGFLAMTIDGGE